MIKCFISGEISVKKSFLFVCLFVLIENCFQMHGMIRIVMKPLITSVPLIGGVQIFFLDQPKIDFELTGVADLLEMPGIR